jgi:hypothetical protein
MPPDIQEIDRRLANIASLIERQQELVAATRAGGRPADAPMRLLASMLRHSRMLEDERSRAIRKSTAQSAVA